MQQWLAMVFGYIGGEKSRCVSHERSYRVVQLLSQRFRHVCSQVRLHAFDIEPPSFFYTLEQQPYFGVGVCVFCAIW